MRNRKLIYLAVALLCIGLWAGNALASVVEKNNLTPVFIQDYVTVNSGYSGDVLTRTLRLQVQNTGSEPLYNVKATLIHITSNGAISQESVVFADLQPGATLQSTDIFECSIDTASIIDGKVQYSWQIEYSNSAGENFVDEALVEEFLQ